MNYLFESRSKNDYDDDGDIYSPPMKWHEFLLILFLILPGAVIVSLAGFAYSFYDIAKDVSESGKLEFSNLVYVGIGITIILPVLISNNLFGILDHPFIAFWSFIIILFTLLFTLAPLTGLVWRFFKNDDNPEV